MSKKFRLLMVLVLVTGLFGGMMTASTVSADPTPGSRFQIPRIDLGNPFVTGISDWDTKIQIQNLHTSAVCVDIDFWGPYLGLGAVGYNYLGGMTGYVIPFNGNMTLHTMLTLNFPTAESAIVTAYDCVTLAPAQVAVTVDRWGTDPFGEFKISSSYTGIADEMHGDNRYFVPYVMYDYHDLDTTLAIQNSGNAVASVWIYYKKEGNCEYQCSQHIEALVPGEAVRVGPGADADVPFPACVTPGWLGSVYISAAQPLGIITDQLSHPNPGANRAVLSSFRGMPYKLDAEGGEWGTEWYADLLYREISGWDASIQVQNLTQYSRPTFVTVDFMDQSGDEILFVGDWICRNGAETFYLPAIIDLGVNYPFGYVGAAEIASHQQVDYPGEHHDHGEPIFAVVDLKKRKMWDPDLGTWRPTVKGENQAGAYNAHPKEEKKWAWDWYMPFIAKEGNGVTSRIALRNNGNCNKFYGKIWIMDETGTDVGVIHTPWLFPKHLKIIDLAYQGWLTPGFVGAARFEVLGVEQLCDTDNNGRVDNEPIYPSIVVLNYGWEAEIERPQPLTLDGDLTRVYEAIPVQGEVKECVGSLLGTVSVRQENHGYDRAEINGADVCIDTLCDTTGSTGGYQIMDVPEGLDLVVTAAKEGFFTGEELADVYCGDETLQDFELICSNPLFVTVEDTAGNPIPGATVSAEAEYEYNANKTETYTTEGTTDNAGEVTFDVAGAADIDLTVSAPGHDTYTTPTGQNEVDGKDAETEENGDCLKGGTYSTLDAGVQLCKWNTVVGTVTIGGHSAAGYYLELIDMGDNPPSLEDWVYTTPEGVFSLENLSSDYKAGRDYRINLYNTSMTFISTTGDFTVDECGETSVFTYTNGVWTDDGTW